MNTCYKSMLKGIRERVEKAKIRAGRERDRIDLISITKNRSISQIEDILDIGLTQLGENRVQELVEKYPSFEDRDVDWHMVGHLQRNKVKYIVRLKQCVMIQSLDSRRLAKKIEEELEKEGHSMDVLVQVNIARDPNKYGFTEEELPTLLEEVQTYHYMKIKGLMTILPYTENLEEIRPFFRRLHSLYETIKEKKIPGIEMKHLSMGMTNDYEIAIEEGATMIRLGSALFGPLNRVADQRG